MNASEVISSKETAGNFSRDAIGLRLHRSVNPQEKIDPSDARSFAVE